jgi:transcriptional regulator with XRE-family HTH domain
MGFPAGVKRAEVRQSRLMPLGLVIRSAREHRGWSQEQLAHRAGVGQGSVSRLERGSGSPSWSVFVRLLDAMDMEPAVTAVQKTSSVDAEMERLRALTPLQRWETQYVDVPVEALARTLSGLDWALVGSAALLAHGVPVKVHTIRVSLVDTDDNLAAVLDRLVRRRWVEVGGASAASGTAAFPPADCAAIMRDIAAEGIVVQDWPVIVCLAESLDGVIGVATEDGDVSIATLDRARPDDAAATAALARWATHLTLGP